MKQIDYLLNTLNIVRCKFGIGIVDKFVRCPLLFTVVFLNIKPSNTVSITILG